MAEVVLLPCPFCHSQRVKLGSKKTGNKSKGQVRVTMSMRCGVCHARGPSVGKDNPTEKDLSEMQVYVRKLWSTR